MKLYIKNMVCDRCILVINNLLSEMQLIAISVQLGEVDLGKTDLSSEKLELFRLRVEALGFELINDKKSQMSMSATARPMECWKQGMKRYTC